MTEGHLISQNRLIYWILLWCIIAVITRWLKSYSKSCSCSLFWLRIMTFYVNTINANMNWCNLNNQQTKPQYKTKQSIWKCLLYFVLLVYHAGHYAFVIQLCASYFKLHCVYFIFRLILHYKNNRIGMYTVRQFYELLNWNNIR